MLGNIPWKNVHTILFLPQKLLVRFLCHLCSPHWHVYLPTTYLWKTHASEIVSSYSLLLISSTFSTTFSTERLLSKEGYCILCYSLHNSLKHTDAILTDLYNGTSGANYILICRCSTEVIFRGKKDELNTFENLLSVGMSCAILDKENSFTSQLVQI